MSSSSGCLEFRAHPLRPDKCRNCFADFARHQSASRAETPTSKNAQDEQPTAEATSETKPQAANEDSSASEQSARRDTTDSPGGQVRAEPAAAAVVVNCEGCNRLSEELDGLRAECREARLARDEAREELKALEKEMEEMHDNFKEDESEQFEQLKQELDLALKNCKILQIRLGKSERQYGQLEQVKSMLERQLSEEAAGGRTKAPNSSSSRDESTNSSQTNSNSCQTFVQLGPETVKLSTSEYDQLLRDLNDIIERERDLQEQIKYSQEEAQTKSDRLQAMETENELLANKVNELTLANAKLRSSSFRAERSIELTGEGDQIAEQIARVGSQAEDLCKLIEQNEQLKLELELAQNEGQRLRNKLQETSGQLDIKEGSLKESEAKNFKLEEELIRLRCIIEQSKQQAGRVDHVQDSQVQAEQVSKLEFECRQLRARLVHSERDCKQLKAQLEVNAVGRQSGEKEKTGASGGSMAVALGEQAKSREINRQLREQCESLKSQNGELLRRIERLSAEQNVGETVMESNLLDKLKKQLEMSENELAKSRSRLVELDLECSRAQRQYKRLVNSLESGGSQLDGATSNRRAKLPVESARDSMSRQELRRAIKDLEEDLEESLATVRSKDCLIREMSLVNGELRAKVTDKDATQTSTCEAARNNAEEQVKSLRRLLEQERLLSNNLKIDVRNLEQSRLELMTCNRMLEREVASIEEEMDKLRELNSELNLNFEETKQAQRSTSNRLIEMQVNCEKLRNELAAAKKSVSVVAGGAKSETANDQSGSADLLLMARDLSELKVKNGFLMRQLEIAQEDNARQLEDLRMSCEAQQRRAVEMAQLEVKERQLGETQQLREELNELKQKLVASQRLLARSDEAVSSERDRTRAAERDWKREKGQWQQKLEQVEAQLTLERRSNEFKTRETEAQVREKERELIGVQDRCVQAERDLKRLQNKYNLLEENSESKQKNLERELECKKRELSDLVAGKQTREQEFYENCKRFNSEKSTLLEALESIRSSFGEKQVELKRIRELLVLRQDQAYKERTSAQERIDGLGRELVRLAEQESHAKVLKQQVEANERQLESLRRDCCQLKEEKTKLRQRCEELEKRCSHYEKQELITKTGNISSSSASGSFLKTRLNFGSSSASAGSFAGSSKQRASVSDQTSNDKNASQCEMIERLSSKINDQRQLMNMLKQQYEEAQLELKQLKLVQSSERARWQSQVAQLSGQLSECEEKLLFETSLVMSQDLYDNSRRKIEAKWAEERRITLDTLKQVQAQNDMLVRDLKKLSQSHDLLRLQSKQLESHNNKLSKKLIEYQQQQQQLATCNGGASKVALADVDQHNKTSRKLEASLLERQAQLGQVLRERDHLAQVLRGQVGPLVETVNKIVAAIDGSGGGGTPDSSASKVVSSSQSSLLDETKSTSTRRPLVAPSPTPSRQSLTDTEHISSGQPAHLLASVGGQPQSRLSRFLHVAGNKSTKAIPSSSSTTTISSTKEGQLEQVEQVEQAESRKPSSLIKTTKVVKRVKIKSAALGISASEKKELRQHLLQLGQVLNGLDSQSLLEPTSEKKAALKLSSPTSTVSLKMGSRPGELRASSADRDLSSLTSSCVANSRGRSQRAGSYAPHSSVGDSSPQSRVHWRDSSTGGPIGADCSDLDSERSWSTSQLERADFYKRFPQTTPASYLTGASLTDCESDCSLASELSSSYSAGRFLGVGVGMTNRRPAGSGAESDGCIGSSLNKGGASAAAAAASRKRKGLKTRLTSTLRNISRSITGLASDSETESGPPSSAKQQSSSWLGRRKQQTGGQLGKQEVEVEVEADVEAEEQTDDKVSEEGGRSLREIRV